MADRADPGPDVIECPKCQKRNTLYLGRGQAECHDCGIEFDLVKLPEAEASPLQKAITNLEKEAFSKGWNGAIDAAAKICKDHPVLTSCRGSLNRVMEEIQKQKKG